MNGGQLTDKKEGCVRGQTGSYIENRSRRATRRGPSNLLAPHQTLFLHPIRAKERHAANQRRDCKAIPRQWKLRAHTRRGA